MMKKIFRPGPGGCKIPPGHVFKEYKINSMKRYSLLIALALCCIPCAGQHFAPEHRHSIELSTGIPPIHAFLLGAGNYAPYQENTIVRACINLGYTYTINEKWDLNFAVNAATQIHKDLYYPSTGENAGAPPFMSFDKSAGPIKTEYGSRWWVAYQAAFRWKWFRSDAVRLYSGAGLSYLPFEWPIFPSLTPIGINFGSGHIYGIGEITFSTAATLALVGVGYRF